MNKSIEQRIKQKLKNIEAKEGIPFNRLLDTLFLERILVRLSKSKHRDSLVFKGGMCLSQFLDLKRITSDIDFLLTNLSASINDMKTILEDVIKTPVNDGFTFTNAEVQQLSLANKKYPGYRLTVLGSLGQVKLKSQIDIGVGDKVYPKDLKVDLLKSNGALFEESITLLAYPPEYIFSEKYEAIIHLKEINGRMKDYFDCYQLIQAGKVDIELVRKAIADTFSTRGTVYCLIPEEYAEVHKARWAGFLRKEKLEFVELGDVIKVINSYLS